MLFSLNHQNVKVLTVDLRLTEDGLIATRVPNIFNSGWVPTSMLSTPSRFMSNAFMQWFSERGISPDRPDIEDIVTALGGNIKNKKAILHACMLLNLGRNITDKYWLSPTKQYVLPKSLGPILGGAIIHPVSSYKGLDFSKNNFSGAFATFCEKRKSSFKNTAEIITPDFCTNSNSLFSIVKRGQDIYACKYFANSVSQEYIQKAIQIANDSEGIIALPKLISLNGTTCGWATKIQTSPYTSLVTIRDLCLSSIKSARVDMEAFNTMVKEYNLDKTDIEKLTELDKKIYDIKKEHVLFNNAGFIIESTSKDIRRPVMWI